MRFNMTEIKSEIRLTVKNNIGTEKTGLKESVVRFSRIRKVSMIKKCTR